MLKIPRRRRPLRAAVITGGMLLVPFLAAGAMGDRASLSGMLATSTAEAISALATEDKQVTTGQSSGSTQSGGTGANTSKSKPRSSSPMKAKSNSPQQEPAGASKSAYSSHTVVASVFWLGEAPSADNDYITNTETEWDPDAAQRFGGYDDPNHRTSTGLPSGFTPKYNPFYFALPVSEHDNNGNLLVDSRKRSPWASETVAEGRSLLKGRWIRVELAGKVVYAQWVDTGPYEEKDYDYVYGSAQPKNKFGLGAGLDLSPAAAHQLGFLEGENGSATVTWRFADEAEAKDKLGAWNDFPVVDNVNYW